MRLATPGRMRLVVALSLVLSAPAWAGERETARELGRVVKGMTETLRRIHKITLGRGAVIADRETGRQLVVFRDKVAIRQIGVRKDVARLVDGRVPIFFKRAVTLGAEIRKAFPGTTAQSARARFRLFIGLLD